MSITDSKTYWEYEDSVTPGRYLVVRSLRLEGRLRRKAVACNNPAYAMGCWISGRWT